MAESAPLPTVLLLGQDHLAADRYAMCSVGDDWKTVCSISLGGLDAIPRKGGTQVPNEDCLFAADFGTTAFHAVADGHKGHRASHSLIERVADLVDSPGAVTAPFRTNDWIYEDIPEDPPEEGDISRTTAALCAIDRERLTAQGWSVGDSAVFHLSLAHGIRRLNESNTVYVSPFQAEPLGAGSVTRFQVDVRPGDAILTCTDGVFECHYGSPATSLLPDDLESLFIRYSADIDAYVAAISHDSLMGVRGNPGGQDNIALIATIV